MKQLKLERWAAANYPPINLNDEVNEITQLINDRKQLRRLLELVKECRTAQKRYFKTRTTENLEASKTAEKRIDKFIQDIENPKLF